MRDLKQDRRSLHRGHDISTQRSIGVPSNSHSHERADEFKFLDKKIAAGVDFFRGVARTRPDPTLHGVRDHTSIQFVAFTDRAESAILGRVAPARLDLDIMAVRHRRSWTLAYEDHAAIEGADEKPLLGPVVRGRRVRLEVEGSRRKTGTRLGELAGSNPLKEPSERTI
jgi:hypothetical protein